MVNTKGANDIAPQVVENITRWHYDRNLIEGASTWTQSKKYLEEYVELVAAQMPEQSPDAIAAKVHAWVDELLNSGRIKTVAFEDTHDALVDSIGDMGVVGINICEREEVPFAYALHSSFMEIKDRKGRMVDGMYIKEGDL